MKKLFLKLLLPMTFVFIFYIVKYSIITVSIIIVIKNYNMNLIVILISMMIYGIIGGFDVMLLAYITRIKYIDGYSLLIPVENLKKLNNFINKYTKKKIKIYITCGIWKNFAKNNSIYIDIFSLLTFSKNEFEALIAHELSHILYPDLKTSIAVFNSALFFKLTKYSKYTNFIFVKFGTFIIQKLISLYLRDFSKYYRELENQTDKNSLNITTKENIINMCIKKFVIENLFTNYILKEKYDFNIIKQDFTRYNYKLLFQKLYIATDIEKKTNRSLYSIAKNINTELNYDETQGADITHCADYYFDEIIENIIIYANKYWLDGVKGTYKIKNETYLSINESKKIIKTCRTILNQLENN